MDVYLEYEDELYLDLVNEDAGSLTILSNGLGLESILCRLVKTYHDPGNLVLIISATEGQQDYVLERLADYYAPKEGSSQQGRSSQAQDELGPPKIIKAESVSAQDRRTTYLQGGCLFITQRILIVDMLLKRCPIHLITGIIVLRAHNILNDFTMSFILRLYRMGNKKGFIKSLSETPVQFTGAIGKLDRIMRYLFASKLFLWPRFHASVQASLQSPVSKKSPNPNEPLECSASSPKEISSNRSPEVIEMRICLTPPMKAIQFAIMDLISAGLKNIQADGSCSSALIGASEKLTAENVICGLSNRMFRELLDPIWHQVSSRAKKLLDDIKWLRSLLHQLTSTDAVTFYNHLKSAQKCVGVNTDISEWLFWDAADTLYSAAKQRVFKNGSEAAGLAVESNPKWSAFCECIDEICKEVKKSQEELDSKDGETGVESNVLVIVDDDYDAKLLRKFTILGEEQVLEEIHENYEQLLRKQKGLSDDKKGEGSGRKRKMNSKDEDMEGLQTLTQMYSNLRQAPEAADEDEEIEVLDEQNQEKQNSDKTKAPSKPKESSADSDIGEQQIEGDKTESVCLHYYCLNRGPLKLERMLYTLKPKYVIMYTPHMRAIRQLERYQAKMSCLSPEDKRLKVYFFIYDGSAEEQKFLTSIRREKEAFEALVKEKASLASFEGRDGRDDNHPDLIRGSQIVEETSTRRGGMPSREQVLEQKVIVDIREFRSELPSLIHKRGIEVEPIQLLIGDYILSNDTCVERKSLSDLIGSLKSGRLLTQMRAMTRHFQRSILLIEFDEERSFHLKARTWGDENSRYKPLYDVMAKLVLLTLHQPAMRIIWSPSPYFSAEFFEYLKKGRPEPDPQLVAAAEKEELPPKDATEYYDLEAKEFLEKLPGVNSVNVYRIMNRVPSIATLIELSIEDLSLVMGSALHAQLLYDTIHEDLNEEVKDYEEQLEREREAKKKKRFAYTKGKQSNQNKKAN